MTSVKIQVIRYQSPVSCDFARLQNLKKNLAKEDAGPKVVNDDLKFLTKEMGIFEERKKKSAESPKALQHPHEN